MTVGLAASRANTLLDSLASALQFIQLHTGDPGAAGTANIAGNDTRKAVTWASAGTTADGQIEISVQIEWSDAEVDTTETYTHVSFWSLVTGGDFEMSGTVTANEIDATGEAARLLANVYTVTLPVAA